MLKISKFRDEYKRLYTDVLAIDAINFRYSKTQFAEAKMSREIVKSYSGFKLKEPSKPDMVYEKLPVIATGNWGCGAFNGDRQLKCKTLNQLNLILIEKIIS